jgi:hypothetical protein
MPILELAYKCNVIVVSPSYSRPVTGSAFSEAL